MFPPKPLDIFSPEGGCSEGLDAFIFFFKTHSMAIPPLLLQYVARFDGGGEMVGFGKGDYKKSRPWPPYLSVSCIARAFCSQEYVHDKNPRGG